MNKYINNLNNNKSLLKNSNNNDDDDNILQRDGFKELREFYIDEILKMANLIARSIYYNVAIKSENISHLSDKIINTIVDEYDEIAKIDEETEEEEE